VAVAAVALLGTLSWGARIGLIVVVLLAVVGFELWSRRAQIADEIAAEQAAQQTETQTQPQAALETEPQTAPQTEPPALPGAPS
jgi:type VI protein secretion system component VasK